MANSWSLLKEIPFLLRVICWCHLTADDISQHLQICWLTDPKILQLLLFSFWALQSIALVPWKWGTPGKSVYSSSSDKIDRDRRGLTIGGSESAWSEDLAAAQILYLAQKHFEETHFEGMYRDKGIIGWIDLFQKSVNFIMKSSKSQFKTKIWSTKEDSDVPKQESMTVKENIFFLTLMWNCTGKIIIWNFGFIWKKTSN